MSYSVNKGSGYVLIQAPDMVLHNGTTQTTEMVVNPESEYLKKLPEHLRSFEDCVAYLPNQVYIGNKRPEDLDEVPEPWTNYKVENADRHGKFGEIMPQHEFIGLIKMVDVFDLVRLEHEFSNHCKQEILDHPLFDNKHAERLKDGADIE